MAFWSDADKGVKDPKRAFRWILVNGNIPMYTLKKVSKPSFTIQESTHKYINHTYYYPGRVEWNTVTMTLVDPVNPDAAAKIAQVITDSGYAPAIQDSSSPKTMSKSSAASTLGSIEIRQIDADGKTVESWFLKNAWIKDVKFGELDYESDDLTMIDLEIRYDWAELRTTGGGKKSFWAASKA